MDVVRTYERIDAKIIAVIRELSAPQCRRILALAWVPFRRASDETLRAQVADAYERGDVTAEQIINEWEEA